MLNAQDIANWGKPKRVIREGVAMTLKKKKGSPEAEIQKAIMHYLKLKGIFCYKQSTTGIYKASTGSYIPNASAGAPDLVAIVRTRHGLGLFVSFEVKTPTGRQSPRQRQFQANIENAGGIYALVRSIDDVERVLNSIE